MTTTCNPTASAFECSACALSAVRAEEDHVLDIADRIADANPGMAHEDAYALAQEATLYD
jgi:hypothetical protein